MEKWTSIVLDTAQIDMMTGYRKGDSLHVSEYRKEIVPPGTARTVLGEKILEWGLEGHNICICEHVPYHAHTMLVPFMNRTDIRHMLDNHAEEYVGWEGKPFFTQFIKRQGRGDGAQDKMALYFVSLLQSDVNALAEKIVCSPSILRIITYWPGELTRSLSYYQDVMTIMVHADSLTLHLWDAEMIVREDRIPRTVDALDTWVEKYNDICKEKNGSGLQVLRYVLGPRVTEESIDEEFLDLLRGYEESFSHFGWDSNIVFDPDCAWNFSQREVAGMLALGGLVRGLKGLT